MVIITLEISSIIMGSQKYMDDLTVILLLSR